MEWVGFEKEFEMEWRKTLTTFKATLNHLLLKTGILFSDENLQVSMV
jgi:hypothetical protein